MELLSVARMREIERAAMSGGAVTGLHLMERAAAGLAAAAAPEPGMPIAVLCGPGNNGGDGYAAARLLAACGASVTVHEMTAAPATPDAAENRRAWIEAGGAVRSLEDAAAILTPVRGDMARVALDALFGAGLTRPLRGPAAALAQMLDARDPGALRVIAADVPSGLCADSGRALGGVAFRADLTVTFHGPKLGHHLADGPAFCGALKIVDIGLRAADIDPSLGARLVGAGPEALDGIFKTGGAHKYDHGHALIVAGGPGRGGAARLAARGALRIGAGLVTLGCPPAAMTENACRLDAVMLRAIAGPEDLRAALEDRRVGAVALGMGLGVGAAAPCVRALVIAALEGGGALALDADALTAFADAPGRLMGLLHERCVLTPHMGEFARLFPDIAERLAAPALAGPAMSRVDAARAAAAQAGCTVLLKGADTIIASPLKGGGARADVHSANYARAAPWLATAGAGDVLAGMIAGLLARGFSAHEAAWRAASLHGAAARAFGPGLIAEDIADAIPQVLRAAGGPA